MKPAFPVTIGHALRVLSDEVYLVEVGDRLIKLAIQIIVRHLNWVLDRLSAKQAMAQDRVLFVLEDLTRLQ